MIRADIQVIPIDGLAAFAMSLKSPQEVLVLCVHHVDAVDDF